MTEEAVVNNGRRIVNVGDQLIIISNWDKSMTAHRTFLAVAKCRESLVTQEVTEDIEVDNDNIWAHPRNTDVLEEIYAVISEEESVEELEAEFAVSDLRKVCSPNSAQSALLFVLFGSASTFCILKI